MTTVKEYDDPLILGIDECQVNLPHSVFRLVVIDDIVVASLKGWEDGGVFKGTPFDRTEQRQNADFQLPSPDQNVVGFNDKGENIWIVPAVPNQDETDDEYFISVYKSAGAVWAVNQNGHSYRLDPQTGNIIESMPANHLRIADKNIEFDGGDVDQILRNDDLLVVRLDNSRYENPESRNIFAFTTEGEQIWQIGDGGDRQAFPTFTNIYTKGEKLFAYNMNGYEYQLDWETGEPLDEEWLK